MAAPESDEGWLLALQRRDDEFRVQQQHRDGDDRAMSGDDEHQNETACS